jgi:hypothetical protein
VAGAPVDFKPSDITARDHKFFMFGRFVGVGAHVVKVRIHSKTLPIPKVLDLQNELLFLTTQTFFQTSLDVLTGKIEGCAPGILCFTKPTPDDDKMFLKTQVAVANQLLPVSGSGIRLIDGESVTDSHAGRPFDVTRDMAAIWLKKIRNHAKAAAYRVNTSYMVKVGYEVVSNVEEQKVETFGVTSPFLRVSLIDGRLPDVLTHELIHSLERNLLHSSAVITPGVNVVTKIAYGENYKCLSPNITIESQQAANVFFENPTTNRGMDFLIDPASYSQAFAKILDPSIDPKVIAVVGAVDSRGKSVFAETQRMEALLGEPGTADIEIRGLNGAGKLVSSVKTEAVKSFEAYGSKGSSLVALPGYLYAAVLPELTPIVRVQVIKDGKIVATHRVAPELTLDDVIERLSKADFKNASSAHVELKTLQEEFEAFEKLVHKERKGEARAALILIKMTASLSLKSSFELKDSSPMTLAELGKLIDAEILKLK